MPQIQKKFGAFSGVFTPSLLTILGVIMYMRLGWVVGEAGIIGALVIIAFAHIISFTTGLSVSSIATDKKIKAGGIYYILSRSLGLPMGGTIGIALFVGTALSISMYIIGFVENFLSIKEISDFLGMTAGVESYRIVGSIVLLFLTIVAFISTSLAIKAQYVILSAIALSLISIFAGFFVNVDFHPVAPLLDPANDSVSFEYVFSIFFPAVTGFTAGVAMSGDLKNPKKDIPLGTITAIVVGFIVYILLALGFGFYVKRDLLLTDFNVAMKIAWSSPLVVAGVWGATLSSALGGILGGPRILQAISNDGITPKFFGKGYGINNEPRNALVFIALIAEGGILIGNLNAIAGIVTMFYLTSYGFINLAYVLESWASSDFRPSFRIPRGVAIVGFLFAFAIMFKIDVLSMTIAFVLMGLLYLILQRRQMKLEYGDVWQSVLINVIRKSLQKISTKGFEERNWQPNIILFSGGTSQRPHLIEFGKSLVGKFGILTNFDLVETKDASVLFPKHKQRLVDKDLLKQGIFMRRQSCRDIYEGIEMIVRTYGFAGLEPNTVILGWGRQSRDPERFVRLINTINELDYNLLLIDYDKRYGYGNKQVIDIWWRGGGNNGNLALAIAKFMKNSDDWYGAKIRLLVVNYENDKASYIYKKVDQILETLRIDAEIKIINNEIERKPVYDIIRQESFNSDIVFLGIPEIEKGKEKDFVERTNKLLHDIGTVVLIKASSLFKEMNLGINIEQENVISSSKINIKKNKEIKLKIPARVKNKEALQEFTDYLQEEYFKELFTLANRDSEDIINSFSRLVDLITDIQGKLEVLLKAGKDGKKKVASIISFHKKISLEATKILDELKLNLKEEESFLLKVINSLQGMTENLWKYAPGKMILEISEDDLKEYFPKRGLGYLFLKLKFNKKGKGYELKVNLKKILKKKTNVLYEYLVGNLEENAINYATHLIKLQKFVKSIESDLSGLRNALYADKSYVVPGFEAVKDIREYIGEVEEAYKASIVEETNEFLEKITGLQLFTEKGVHDKELKMLIASIPAKFVNNTSLFINGVKMELLLAYADAAFNHYMKLLWYEGVGNVKTRISYVLSELINALKQVVSSGDFNYQPVLNFEAEKQKIVERAGNIKQKIRRIASVFPVEEEIISDDDYNEYFEKVFDDLTVVNTKMETLVSYLFEEKVYSDIDKITDELIEIVKQAYEKENEVYRLMIFTIQSSDLNESVKELALQEIEKLKTVSADEKLDEIESIVFEGITTVSSKLTLYSLLKIAMNFRTYVRKIEKVKKASKIKEVLKKRESFFVRLYVRIKYGKAFLFETAESNLAERKTYASDLLRTFDEISPDESIISQLPFYYNQIFSSDNVHYKDFCTGREFEFSKLKQAVNYYDRGYKGAIVITGSRYGGKSMVAYITASEYAGKDNVFVINPPQGGRVSIKDFRKEFFNVFQHQDALNGTDFLHSFDKKTAIILEDIEMWWNRLPGSTGVVDEIIKIIETFGNKILFFITSSNPAYELLTKISTIETVVLERVDLKPLKPETIKEAVYLRHDTTGIKFKYEGKSQDMLTLPQEADIFVKLYELSAGNPGLALYYWLSSIRSVGDNEIEIKMPEKPYMRLFDSLGKEHLFVLWQLVLHKSLSIGVLNKYAGREDFNVEKVVDFLVMNSLVEKSDEIVKITKAWYSFVYSFLKNKGLI